MEQPDVRRRLNFEGIDAEMSTPPGSPREGRERDSPLPGSDSATESDSTIDLGETDEESSSSGDEEGDNLPGYRILYEGHGRPIDVRLPHRGYATIIGRYPNGYTRVARIPLDAVHIAMPRAERTQAQRNTPPNEGNDRQRE